MEKREKQCPVCNSTEVLSYTVEEHVQSPYGQQVDYNAVEDHCNNCGEKGDFYAENDVEIEDAIQKSNNSSVHNIIDALSKMNKSIAYIERSLRLPAYTIARWKRGEVSAEGIALLRLIMAYPKLLESSDSNFGQSVYVPLILKGK